MSKTSSSISKVSITRSSLKGSTSKYYGQPLPSKMRIASITVYETKKTGYEEYDFDDNVVDYYYVDGTGTDKYTLLVGSPLLYVIKTGDKWQVRNEPQYEIQKGPTKPLNIALINGEILFPGCTAVTTRGIKYRYLGLLDPLNKKTKYFVETVRPQNNCFLKPEMITFSEVQMPQYLYAFDEQINTINDNLGNSLFNSLDL